MILNRDNLISLYLCAVLQFILFSAYVFTCQIKHETFFTGFLLFLFRVWFICKQHQMHNFFFRKLIKSLWYMFNQLVDGKILSSHWIIPSNRKCLSIFLTNQCERKVTEHQNLCLTPTWWDYISLDSAFKMHKYW